MLSNFGFILEILNILLSDSGSRYINCFSILLWKMIFFFLRNQNGWCLGCTLLPAFCSVVLMLVQSQNLCCALQLCPAYVLPIPSLGPGHCSTLELISQSLGCAVWGQIHVYSLEISASLWTTVQDHFFEFSGLCSLLLIARLPQVPFPGPLDKSQGFGFPILLFVSNFFSFYFFPWYSIYCTCF